MPASAPPVRRHCAPAADGVPFEALVAERLRQAPTFASSLAAHALALLLLWLLLPAPARATPRHHVEVAAPDPAPVATPEPERMPEVAPEKTDEPVVVDANTPIVDAAPADDAGGDAGGDDASTDAHLAADLQHASGAIGFGPTAGGPYTGRSGRKGPGTTGGGIGAQPSIDAALRWLRAHQDDDGRWDCDGFAKHDDPSLPACSGPGNGVHDVGVTGLALLAFLGDGSTMRSGPYRDQVKKAVLWLRAQQRDDGLFGAPVAHDYVYDHAIAAYAMCEAYGLSGYSLLRDPAQKGLDHLAAHRNPYGVWRYQPRDGDGDTSITGWCVMALAAGKHFGLAVDATALQTTAVWLDTVTDASGRHGYTAAGQRSSRKPGDHGSRFPADRTEAMTAVGLFARFFLGQDPAKTPAMPKAADLLLLQPPAWDEAGGRVDHYAWYYASYALFQMGGKRWTAWQKQLEPTLLKKQHRDPKDGNRFGSWDPDCAWGEDGGRVYSTAILALCLQANYRYSRLLH
jgi:hypothetical protein